MKIRSLYPALLMAPLTLLPVAQIANAQNSGNSVVQPFESSSFDSSAPVTDPAPASGTTRGISGPAPAVLYGTRPFSRFSIGGSFGALGAGVESSTNLIPHLNLRLSGNYLGFAVNNLKEQGFNLDANLHLASARASVDYYPFHKAFRLSPGVMFYNQNHAVATLAVPGGASFTVDNQTYYSETGDQAVRGAGRLRIGSSSPVFTATTGWGNTIPREGHHFSFPVEIGAAFQKAPTIAINLSGTACYDSTRLYCTDLSDLSNPIAAQIHQGVETQVAKYQKDIEPLKTYPILSFGVAYSFGSGRMSTVR